VTSKVWLKYVAPNYYIQERRNVLARYEIQAPELGSAQLGMVEKYFTDKDSVKWRSLDYRKNDWKSDWNSREEAAQDLILNCPVVAARVKHLRERIKSPEESQD
jgi:hypothetical protein